MTRPPPRRLKRFVCRQLRLAAYLAQPGAGRPPPRSSGPSSSGKCSPPRPALGQSVRRAKRNKAFEQARFLGLALDGTSAGWRTTAGCSLCHPVRAATHQVTGHLHRLVLLSVVGSGLTLPVDVEPSGPGDSEDCRRAPPAAPRGARPRSPVRRRPWWSTAGFATGPFLHTGGTRGLRVVARRKGNLPELAAAVQARFARRPPPATFRMGRDRVEVWDADDFDPWESLRWTTVRVLRVPPTPARRLRGGGRLADRLPDPAGERAESVPRAPRAGGQSRTRASTTARRGMGSSTSAITRRPAC